MKYIGKQRAAYKLGYFAARHERPADPELDEQMKALLSSDSEESCRDMYDAWFSGYLLISSNRQNGWESLNKSA